MPPFTPNPRRKAEIDRSLSRAVRLRRDLLAELASIEVEAERAIRARLVNLTDVDDAIEALLDQRVVLAKMFG